MLMTSKRKKQTPVSELSINRPGNKKDEQIVLLSRKNLELEEEKTSLQSRVDNAEGELAKMQIRENTYQQFLTLNDHVAAINIFVNANYSPLELERVPSDSVSGRVCSLLARERRFKWLRWLNWLF